MYENYSRLPGQRHPRPQNSGPLGVPAVPPASPSYQVQDQLSLSEALGMQGALSETRDDIPVREVARHVAEDGRGSGVDIDRGECGNSRAKRTMHPVAPAPRDPPGERKRADEREAVRVLLPDFNRLHRTSYEKIEKRGRFAR